MAHWLELRLFNSARISSLLKSTLLGAVTVSQRARVFDTRISPEVKPHPTTDTNKILGTDNVSSRLMFRIANSTTRWKKNGYKLLFFKQ
ncbi:MAG TPA: hypothetical protein DIC49_02980 [Gammaproteobacteria bacterium]|nr:hypothetical protein [Gammaproteobacteria bacterium]